MFKARGAEPGVRKAAYTNVRDCFGLAARGVGGGQFHPSCPVRKRPRKPKLLLFQSAEV